MKKGGRTYKSILVGLGAIACVTVLTLGAWSGGWVESSAWGTTGLAHNLPKTLSLGLPIGLFGLGGSAIIGAGLMRLWSARQFGRRLVERDRQLGSLREELAQSQDDLIQCQDRHQTETQQQQEHYQALAQKHCRLQQQLQTLEQQQRQERQAATQSLAQAEQDLAAYQQKIDAMTVSHNRDIEEIQADVEVTWDENEKLAQERDALQGCVAELKQALADSRSNVDALMKHQSQGAVEGAIGAIDGAIDDGAEKRGAIARENFADVGEALAAAQDDFGDVLEVWESAIAAAEDSQFGRPDEVYRALAAIAEVARDSFSGEDVKGGWRNGLREYGLDYKPTEHQVTKTKYGGDRDFRHRGRKQRMLKHITLGRNSVIHNLQIYFEVDRDRQKIDIGYCGKHLRCYGWDS